MLEDNKAIKSVTFKIGASSDSQKRTGGNIGVGFNF